jgi:hypothetical protein
MLKSRPIGVWLAILGVALTVQGCWDEQDQLELLGDGGCRTADGGEGGPTHFSEMSLDECKAQCFDGDAPCAAVEFNANNSKCEVHFEPITKFEAVEGVACYVAARRSP